MKMIEQQYYTRERKGVFSKTPGYDTVARSMNLDNQFIIDTLHALCFYEAPVTLIGEKDILEYPVSLFCVNTDDNRMVIGQSVFAGEDYTGQRNRYFTHNYIIPEDEKDKYIESPEKIIYSTGFTKAYDIEKGMIIPEVLEILQGQNEDCFNSIEEMFSVTGMNSEVFVKLIKACFDGASFGKKIYVVLDSKNNNISILAKAVLKYLYRALPFEVRRKIGFITYMKEAKIKNLINIVFLHKGSIRRLSTEIKAGYVFDLADKSFYLDGIDDENHVFIDFVMDNIENTEILKEFFYKADKVCVEDKLSIYKYDNILDENLSGKDLSGALTNDVEDKKERVHPKMLEETKNKVEDQKQGNDSEASSLSVLKRFICFIKKLR